MGTLYPAPGHCSVVLPDHIIGPVETETAAPVARGGGRRRARSAAAVEAEEETMEKVFVLTLGGGARISDKLWRESSRPVVTSFSFLENDIVSDENSYLPNLTGADLPGLDYAGVAAVFEDKKLVVWGGEVTWSRAGDMLTKSNHLFELALHHKQNGKLKIDVTKFAEPGKVATSRLGKESTEQKGNIPQGRNGHTFIRIGDAKVALMFGGVTLGPQRNRGAAILPPKEECFDCSMYLLDLESYKWTDAGPLMGLMPRAYHSSCFTQHSNPTGTILLVGGMRFVSDHPSERIPINTVQMIHVNDLSNHRFSTETLQFDVSPAYMKFTSMAASTCIDHALFIFGGHMQDEASIQHSETVQDSNILYHVDLNNGSAKATCTHSMPTTAGASLLPLADDLLLIAGGTTQHFSVYTKRNIEPSTSDLHEKH